MSRRYQVTIIFTVFCIPLATFIVMTYKLGEDIFVGSMKTGPKENWS